VDIRLRPEYGYIHGYVISVSNNHYFELVTSLIVSALETQHLVVTAYALFFFFLSSFSYSTFPPKSALVSPLWKYGAIKFNTVCRIIQFSVLGNVT